MVGHRGSSAGSYLADPTSPTPSHCASIVVTSTVRVNMGCLCMLTGLMSPGNHQAWPAFDWCWDCTIGRCEIMCWLCRDYYIIACPNNTAHTDHPQPPINYLTAINQGRMGGPKGGILRHCIALHHHHGVKYSVQCWVGKHFFCVLL